MVECIIIGSSVAGISAALTLNANAKNFLMFGSKDLSPKIYKAEKIKNYPAFLGENGKEFCENLKKQLEREEIEIQDERVSGVYAMKEKFVVATQQGGMYEAKTVILACGVETGKRIEGETEFLGRGVSYCATCDGFLYKNKKIAVVCLSETHVHEAEYLFKIAEKTYFFPLFKGAKTYENVQNIVKMPTKIVGEKRVNGIVYVDKDGEKTMDIGVDVFHCVSGDGLVIQLKKLGNDVELSLTYGDLPMETLNEPVAKFVVNAPLSGQIGVTSLSGGITLDRYVFINLTGAIEIPDADVEQVPDSSLDDSSDEENSGSNNPASSDKEGGCGGGCGGVLGVGMAACLLPLGYILLSKKKEQ